RCERRGRGRIALQVTSEALDRAVERLEWHRFLRVASRPENECLVRLSGEVAAERGFANSRGADYVPDARCAAAHGGEPIGERRQLADTPDVFRRGARLRGGGKRGPLPREHRGDGG